MLTGCCPPRSAPLAVALAVGTYIGIAHYDNMFACEEHLRPFDGWFAVPLGGLSPLSEPTVRMGGESASFVAAALSCFAAAAATSSHLFFRNRFIAWVLPAAAVNASRSRYSGGHETKEP